MADDEARIDTLEQQILDLQTQIAAQTAQLTQQAAQIAVQGQAVPPPVIPQPAQQGPFALTPALANRNVIDLLSAPGIKLYKSITTPLDNKFDGTAKELVLFMDELRRKAEEYGWNQDLLQVSDRHPVTPTIRNLLSFHCLIDIEDVQAHARTYIGTQSRIAQDSSMMYIFIKDSLTKGARTKMATEHQQYDINGTPDGPCFLKALLATYFVETIATNFVLRERLIDLPNAMKRLKFNVSNFNSYVNEITLNLTSGGETSTDMIVYLFKAYREVKDANFLTYMAHKKEAYEDGTLPMTPLTLMSLALTKYNLLQSQKTWLHKTKEEDQLVALTAQLKAANVKLQELSKVSQTPTTTRSPHPGKHKDKHLDAWYFENPDNLDKMSKDGVTYYWCSYDKRWGNHKTAKCYRKIANDKRVAAEKAKSNTHRGKHKDKKATAKALTLAKALIAMTEGADGEESYSDDDST
jgi:hypothetical protein